MLAKQHLLLSHTTLVFQERDLLPLVQDDEEKHLGTLVLAFVASAESLTPSAQLQRARGVMLPQEEM